METTNLNYSINGLDSLILFPTKKHFKASLYKNSAVHIPHM